MALSDTITKSSPKAAEYTPNGSRTEHCSICRHYVPDNHTCMRITGRVVPGGWCKFFLKASQ